MSFEVLLNELVSRVEGAEGAIILDVDGEAVQWSSGNASERLRLRAAYVAVAFRSCREALKNLNLGAIEHLIIKYEGAGFILQELDSGCFVVVELSPRANLSQALYRMQPSVLDLRREITA